MHVAVKKIHCESEIDWWPERGSEKLEQSSEEVGPDWVLPLLSSDGRMTCVE